MLFVFLVGCAVSPDLEPRPLHAERLASLPTWLSEESEQSADVVPGDFDGDGDPDLAVINDQRGPAHPNRVYRNVDGALELVWTAPDAPPAKAAAWGDLDGDGDLDLAVAYESWSPTPLRVYAWTGATFELAWEGAAAMDAWDVDWADWDGDGDVDLAVAGYGDRSRVYANDGGTLTLAWGSPDGEPARSVAWGDMDGDGDPDLALGGDLPDQVWTNDGGTLSLTWEAPEDVSTEDVAWADVDGDGDLDLFAVHRDGDSVLYRNDGGSFALAQVVEGFSHRGAAWADRDGDGDPDLALAVFGGPDRVLDNTDGVLADGWASGEATTSTAVAWADFDGDGAPDLVAATHDQTRIYGGGGEVCDGRAWADPARRFSWAVALGDSDGDGRADLAVGQPSGPVVFLRNTGGALSPAWESDEGGAWGLWDVTADLAWADVDGDGDQDLIAGNVGDEVSLQPNRLYLQDGGLVEAWASPELERTTAVAWADWDGDGDPDLAVGNGTGCTLDYECGAGQDQVYRNDGGVLTLAWRSSAADDTVALTWADLDGDGDSDLVTASGFGPVRVYRNDGGVLTDVWNGFVGEGVYALAAGDTDGDGRAAVALGHRFGTPVRVALWDGAVLETVWEAPVADDGLALAFADVDRDGDPDLAAGGDGVRVWRNEGGGFVDHWVSPWRGEVADLSAADWNGDGFVEVAVAMADGSDLVLALADTDGDGVLDPCDDLAVDPPRPPIAGGPATWHMRGATPGAELTLVGSLTPGATPVPACGVEVGLRRPRVLGRVTAEADGHAAVVVDVPEVLGGREVGYAAVELGTCRVSATDGAAIE
ncbi:MAG: hypothetical protein ACI8PZ_002283 [Myxococcota bacterium]|jgi:hypothetical protein